MSHFEYQLVTTRRGELLREATARRCAREAATSLRPGRSRTHLVGGAVRRLSRVAAVRMAH